ncbi:autotransporter outer membrane beta-barrel domain-containing protein [Alysiella filiformis]|uniref:Outer membrane autotransporter barrel domain-containing protein n=1 Tax=Alysiella filiformis DSM 16848 TaxID=1120981 RepID=A0A286EH05_9NEIS|nr:autotransporter outer membrane beta-barrel domain-containing protein [Alysiella filiformis]QMT32350.1 autotransporter outer membrane beta-barrel domain-containing protein [Alysiella filiformis]UBQ56730.1 autotransporter outer membrane beta-barrel domain-containing protein [Alysiella filiformis DSM 16848]SOD70205.1 outer membrane autotransporter barrel domain-containing protein [Alysiella filiformis DSM 16848]
MKKSFSKKILAMCVATAFVAPNALAADPQVVRHCTENDSTTCHFTYNFTYNNPNNVEQWQHNQNYFEWTHNNAPLQKEDLASTNLKVVVSGNVKNKTTNSTGIKPSSFPNQSFEKRHDHVVGIYGDALNRFATEETAELEVLPNTVATLSMQPEDSSVIYVVGNTTANIHKNARLVVNPSYAEVNQVDMTQYDEEKKDDYQAGSAIEAYGDKAKVNNSADIELTGKNASGVRVYDNATVNMSNHSIQLNGNWTMGFDTLNKGKITADNVQISGSAEKTFAFIGDNIHLNNSKVDLTGKSSFVTDNIGGDETTITQNINNSTLSAEYGIFLTPDEEDKFNYVMNLQNSTLSGRTALLVAQPENLDVFAEGDVVGNITLNAHNSTLSGASILNNQSANATANRNITLNLTHNSTWTIQNSSEIDTLKLDNATVKIGKANGYNTLTVNGDLSGNGAFHMNSDIAGNQSDLLDVKGAVSGSHVLHIENTRSEPATTDGKLTVVKTGSSGADAFKLGNAKGVVEAGKYLYALKQNGNNWQLVYDNTQKQPENTTQPAAQPNTTVPAQNANPVAQPNTTVPAQNANPVAQPNTTAPAQNANPVAQPNTTAPAQNANPVAQPNTTTPAQNTTTPSVNKNFRYDLVGSMAHAQVATSALQAQNQVLNQRQLALHQAQRLHGAWILGENSQSERKNSSVNGGNVSGFKDKSNAWQIGLDKEMGNGYAGVLAGYGRHNIDYHVDLYDDSKIRSHTFAAYGGLTGSDGWFGDATLRHTRYTAENPQFARDRFRINSLNLQGGKNVALNETWTLIPNASVTIGRLSGSNMMKNSTLLQSRAGVDVQSKWTSANGVLFQPKLGVYYVGDHRGVDVAFNQENFRAKSAGSRVAARVGTDVFFNKNNQIHLNLHTEHGNQFKRHYGLDVGLRHAW